MLGAISMPGYQTGYTHEDIRSHCDEYAKALALEALKRGVVHDLNAVENDAQVCMQAMANRRVLNQLLLFGTVLGGAAFGYFLWSRR